MAYAMAPRWALAPKTAARMSPSGARGSLEAVSCDSAHGLPALHCKAERCAPACGDAPSTSDSSTSETCASHVLYRCFTRDAYPKHSRGQAARKAPDAPSQSLDLLESKALWPDLPEVFVFLFGQDCQADQVRGVYTLRTFTTDNDALETVVAFESIADAERFANLLATSMDHLPTVHSIQPEQLTDFCQESGYGCQLERDGSSLTPPGYTVSITDWERALRLRSGAFAVLEEDPCDPESPAYDAAACDVLTCSSPLTPVDALDAASVDGASLDSLDHLSLDGLSLDKVSMDGGVSMDSVDATEADVEAEDAEAETPYKSLTPYLEEQVALHYAELLRQQAASEAPGALDIRTAPYSDLLEHALTDADLQTLRERLEDSFYL